MRQAIVSLSDERAITGCAGSLRNTICETPSSHEVQEFLEHVHNIFNKPWERYNAHLHLENDGCNGRLNPSEWEAGGYFEPEFLVNNRLVLFAHFEGVETRKRKRQADVEEKDNAWRWDWCGSEGPEDKV
jgi:hypothetical protein